MIKVYILDIRQLGNIEQWDKELHSMPQERIRKVTAAKRVEDKLRSLGAGLLLAHGLFARGIRYEDACFATGEYGKTYLVGENTACGYVEHKDVFFNISHAGNYVACCIADVEVGIDIEQTRENWEKIARRFFHKSEVEYLLKEKESGAERFLQLWTMKEAAVKRMGMGLRFPLDAIRCSHEIGEMIAVEKDEKMWHYKWDYRSGEECGLSENYGMSIVADHITPQEVVIEQYILKGEIDFE